MIWPIVVPVFLVFSSLAWAESEIWREAGDDRIRILFHAPDEVNVAGLIQAIERSLPELESKLATSMAFPARIYLAASQTEFDRLTSARLPSWSQGVTFPETGAIVLKSPGFSHDIETFQRTAIHELAHLMIAHKAGANVPRWLNEGLALLLSGEGAGKPLMPLSWAIWSGTVMDLEEIEWVDRLPHADAELAYLESYHSVEYFVKQYGWESLRRILDDMGQGLFWADALFRETEVDQAGFEAAWRVQLQKSYRWMLLLNVQALLILAMLGLVGGGFVMMVRRRRQIYRKWAAEDGGGEGIF